MTNSKRQLTLYLTTDAAAALLAFVAFTWLRFGLLRALLHPEYTSFMGFLLSPTLLAECVLMPALFVAVSWATGFYGEVMFKSRMQVVGNTIVVAALCTLLFYLLAMTNDYLPRRMLIYRQLGMLFGLMALVDGVVRWIVSTAMSRRIRRGEWSMPVVVVGASRRAAQLGRRLMHAKPTMGLDVTHYIDLGDGPVAPALGAPVEPFEALPRLIGAGGVKALVLSPEKPAPKHLMPLVAMLLPYDLPLYVQPETSNLSHPARGFHNVAGEPLVDVARADVPHSVRNLKRIADVAVSTVALAVLSPLMLALAVAVKLDSPGPVFYRQRRVGYHKKPFDIIKFRSMHPDAEAAGVPLLSSTDDERVTRLGRFMRKYRLDELPNFFNVLKGEMSLVGPRPERPFFVKKIIERNPAYALIHSVRPGITSWGMVKFGYASTVDEMLERMRYDILYVQNVTLGVDLKILFYTVRTVLTGRGV